MEERSIFGLTVAFQLSKNLIFHLAHPDMILDTTFTVKNVVNGEGK